MLVDGARHDARPRGRGVGGPRGRRAGVGRRQQLASLVGEPAAERLTGAQQQHAAPGDRGAARRFDRQHGLAGAGRTVEDDARIGVDRLERLELLFGVAAYLVVDALGPRLGTFEELEVAAQVAQQLGDLLLARLMALGVEPGLFVGDELLSGVVEHALAQLRERPLGQRPAVDHLPRMPLLRGLGEIDERKADRRPEHHASQVAMLVDEPVAQAVHGLGRLLEGAALVGAPLGAVEPEAVVAAQVVSAFDLEHEHALAGHDDEKVDLARQAALVVGQVERMQHDPVVGAPGFGEGAEHHAFAVAGRRQGDGRGDQAGRHARSPPLEGSLMALGYQDCRNGVSAGGRAASAVVS